LSKCKTVVINGVTFWLTGYDAEKRTKHLAVVRMCQATFGFIVKFKSDKLG